MSWAVEFLNREDGCFLHAPEACIPISLEWNDRLGADQALIRCENSGLNLRYWEYLLGQDVRVYDPAGRLAWWGFLDKVEQHQAGCIKSLDLGSVFNKVAVLYQNSALFPQGPPQRSAWKDDLISQDGYGIRQKLLRRAFLHEQVADQMAEKYLEEHACLATRLESFTKEDGDHFILRCKGWMHSLAWRIWEGWNGVVEHRPAQSGVQSLGMEAGSQRIGQSFTVPESVDSFSFAIRVRRQGLPSDRLVIALQADANGKPSGSDLISKDIQGADLNDQSYQWLDLVPQASVRLLAGNKYWLVLKRSAGIDAQNGYWIGLDENLGFGNGSMLLYNGSSWPGRSPEADLLFRIVGRKTLAQQITDLVDFAGQFLNGVDTSQIEGLALPLFLRENQDCLRCFFDLLEQGNAGLRPLRAAVSPTRRIQIWRQPSQSEAIYYLERNGNLSNRFGQPLSAPWQAVGQWLHTWDEAPVYVSNMKLKIADGKVSINRSVISEEQKELAAVG